MVISAPSVDSHPPGIPAPPLAQAARLGRIFDIKRFSSHDGPGIRSTVFLTGCPLRCAWCHNPEALVCQDDSPDGRVRQVTVAGLVRELERDVPYFDASGGGVTISGGEPLGQARFVLDLLRACRQRELHTAIDTSGCADPAVMAEAAGLTDLILYDLKAMDPGVHREWTGVGNQRILDNLELLNRLATEVWIRLPVIPGVNDDSRNLDALISLLLPTRFRRVSILPYHRIAEAKYQRLGLPNRMAGIEPPTPARLAEIRELFAAAGFAPHIGH
jgi:pyruvate formate lyase activating enzyme